MKDGNILAIQIAFALLVVEREADTIELEGGHLPLAVFQFVNVQVSVLPLVGIVVEDRAVVVLKSVALQISVFGFNELTRKMLVFLALLGTWFAVIHADFVTVVALLS